MQRERELREKRGWKEAERHDGWQKQKETPERASSILTL